jgi:4-carboxymuconolactone decarboxylase
MARLRYVDAAELSERDRGLLDQSQNLYRTLAHSPDALRGLLRMGAWIRFRSDLDRRLSELAILAVTHAAVCRYAYAHHLKHATELGIPASHIDAARGCGHLAEMPELEAAVIDAGRGLESERELPPGVYARLRAGLSDAQIVDLMSAIGLYSMIVRLIAGLDIELEDDPQYQALLARYPLTAST